MKTFKSVCGCEIHVIKWSAKANSVSIKYCHTHNGESHAAQLQAACVELRETAAQHVPWDYGKCACGEVWRLVDSKTPYEDWGNHIRAILIPIAALETALDKKQTETITACAFAVCEGCKNGWLLSHGSHQTPQQGQWFPCKADAILALSPYTIQKSKALFEAAILEMCNRYAKSFASPIREAILSLPLPSTAALETAIAEARLEVAVEISERSVHGMIPDGFELWLDDYVEEKKAALDAAKAKESE